jgi:hypothetical protein
MGHEAKVTSIPALKQLRASLGTFATVASLALDEAATRIQHTHQWLREDQHHFWRAQVQARTEQFTRAKLALKQRQVFERTLAGSPSSCVDEKKALKVAEARLQEAEYKLRRVKAWSLQIEKERSDYRAAMQRLASAIEVEIPNARARLDRMIDSLEAYLALAPPETGRSVTDKPESEVAAPAEPPASMTPEQPAPAPPSTAENNEAPSGKMPRRTKRLHPE